MASPARSQGVADGEQMRVLAFHVTQERLDLGLWLGVPGHPKWHAMAHGAMKSRVEPEVI